MVAEVDSIGGVCDDVGLVSGRSEGDVSLYLGGRERG